MTGKPPERAAADIEELLARLRERLPEMADLPAADPSAEALAQAALKDLVRDAGRALQRLRRRPRAETAPLARFREACRDALLARRLLARARIKMTAALRRMG